MVRQQHALMKAKYTRTTEPCMSSLVRLNGVPVHWRSSVQKAPAISPAEAEIYALSEGVRDCTHVANVAEEMAVDVKWPLKVQVDNNQAMSFCNETCVRSWTR